MKGHLAALLTTGLAAIALVLALLQAAVLFHSAPRYQASSAARGQSNRFSVPGGRSGVPWLPFEKAQPPSTTPEGRSPEKQQEEHRSPPPSRQRGVPPSLGPRPQRRASA